MSLLNCLDPATLSSEPATPPVPVSFDSAAVVAHVTLLHELAAGCEGVLILVPIWEGKSPLPQRFRVGDVAAMVSAIMAYDGVPGVNLYAPYCTMRPDLEHGKKGGERDVKYVLGPVADIDADKVVQTEIAVEPSYVVESSPGNYQRVYFFPHPLPAADAKPVLRTLCDAIGGDAGQQDCSHVWRIPGTLNWPTKSKLARGRDPAPAPVTVYKPCNGVRVDPVAFLALAPAEPPGKPMRKPKSKSATPKPGGSTLLDGLDGRDDFPKTADNIARLRSALPWICATDRDAAWRPVAMALKTLEPTWGPAARQIFDWWSKKFDPAGKFAPAGQERMWNTVAADRDEGIGVGTLFWLAKKAGWVDTRGLTVPPPPDNETPPQLPTGVTLDDFVAYMPAHTYIFKPSREPWPGASVNARIAPVANGAGKPLAASAWLDKNAPVEQMTWAPGKPAIIRNQLVLDGGFVRRDGASVFNLYKPPIAEPGDAAKAGLWLDHVYRVFPGDGGDHFLKWCAYRVQHPEIKINHALILGGEQGVGKDTAMEPAKHAVGHWNFAEVKPKQIMQRFNPCLRSVILRVSEGRDLGEVDRYQFYDHLKDYIASPPDVLRVDEKNLREHMVINCTGFVITTNHKTGGLYLPPDDRRHYVMWCGLRRDDFSAAYWPMLYNWYARGGLDHAATYLREFDVSEFDPKAPPPRTEAWHAIVNSNAAPEDAELADVLDSLGNPEAVTQPQVVAKATGDVYEWLTERKNRRVVPHRFEACGYVMLRNPDAADGSCSLCIPAHSTQIGCRALQGWHG